MNALNFVHAWLEDAYEKAKDRITSNEEMDRFLIHAWRTLLKQGSSTHTGRNWQP